MAAPSTNNELYTRGTANMPDLRGQSMVAKHADKMQKEKEERAMAKLQLLLPQLGAAVKAVALQECGWDAEKALIALRRFLAAKSAELNTLQKERRRHLQQQQQQQQQHDDGETKRGSSKGKRRRSNSRDNSSHTSSSSSGSDSSSSSSSSDSDSSGSSSSSSDDEDDDRHRKRKKKSSSKHKSKSSSKSRERHRDAKNKKKKKKKEKKEKKKKDLMRRKKDIQKERKKKETKPTTYNIKEYGTHGIIRETDLYAKRPEFMLWATEIKNIDIDAMPKYEEKELFKTYIEDYNTATLPHKKYYDIDAYEKLKASSTRHRGGATSLHDVSMLDDEGERRKEIALQRQKEKEERLQQAYQELKTTDKAKDMREQEMLRAKMALAYRTGDQKEALKLAERLKPDDI